jgi:hypothetical protein
MALPKANKEKEGENRKKTAAKKRKKKNIEKIERKELLFIIFC